jgi:hypothetical protein
MASLNDDLTAKVDDVPLGDVEQLLREVRKQFYKTTVQSKSKLKKQLQKAQLEDHADLGAYIAHVNSLCKRLAGLGSPVTQEDKEFHLLEGLPDDYAAIKQNIKIPREPQLTWEQVVFLLEDFSDNPRIPGSSQKPHRSDAAHNIQDSNASTNSNICRHFSKHGNCKFGNNCKYAHVKLPEQSLQATKCNFCGNNGHKEKECKKKARAITQLKQELKAMDEDSKTSKHQQQDTVQSAYDARVQALPIAEEPKIDIMSF